MGDGALQRSSQQNMPDDHSEWAPPDPMPNSEVKPLSADGSVEFLHVRVGHRQALTVETPVSRDTGVFFGGEETKANRACFMGGK